MDNVKTTSSFERIPTVGEKLHFFDDGKVSDCRHYFAIVTHILSKDQIKQVYFDSKTICNVLDAAPGSITNIIEAWEYIKKEYTWLYAEDTDVFIGCSIPEYDDHIIWFVREKHGGWFSLDLHSNWQGGRLDVDGKIYQRMIDEGYTYSERI